MKYPTIEDAIGQTPLVALQRIGAASNSERGNVILGKLEGNNPAGSVKDRPAMAMIARAEQRGARAATRRSSTSTTSALHSSSSSSNSYVGRTVADPVDAWQQLAAVAAVHGSVTVRRAGKVQGVRLVPAALAGPTGSAVPSVQVAP